MDLGVHLLPREKYGVPGNIDVSVVIAHRGSGMGLWFTIESCDEALKNSGLNYEFIVVANGEEKLHVDVLRLRHQMSASGRLGDFIHVPEELAPPSAREVGTWSAKGEYIFFLDNHCLVNTEYFTRAISSMKKYNIGMLHSTTNFWKGETNWYEYRMAFERHFWVDKSWDTPLSTTVPYRVGVGGHGGFAVTRKLWDKVAGYWMGFEGYAGEEPYFDLKCWRMGEEVWIDPLMIHKHWSGERSYNRHYTDDYIKNLLMAAHIIGGEKWMYNVSDNFQKSTRISDLRFTPKPLIDLIEEAYNRSKEHADWVDMHSVQTLDECLAKFSREGIRI